MLGINSLMISAVLLLYLDELVDEICGDYGFDFHWLFLGKRAVVNVVGGMPLLFDMFYQLIWSHPLVRQKFL